MIATPYRNALIVGAGPGLSASLARTFVREAGLKVALASRDPARLQPIVDETGATALACDATDPAQVGALFAAATKALDGAPEVVVYNASRRVPGAFVDVDPAAMRDAVAVSAFGAFHVAQHAARAMLAVGKGAILFTGASASVKGYPKSSAFAMGKFAQRGLAQSLARELAPQGIHVAHVVIDGAIGLPGATARDGDRQLDPDAIAMTYLHLLAQPRSTWTWEVEVRPWVERF